MRKIVLMVGILLMAGAAYAADINCNGPGDDSCGNNNGNTVATGGNASANSTNNNVNTNTNVNVASQGQEQGQFQGQQQGQLQGQKASVSSSIAISGDNHKVNTPSIGAPGLAAANCMGSWSVGGSGGNGLASAGLGFGKTVESKECNRRAYAEHLFNLSERTGDSRFLIAGVLLLSENKEVRKALIDAGFSSDAWIETSETNAPEGADKFSNVRPDWYKDHAK